MREGRAKGGVFCHFFLLQRYVRFPSPLAFAFQCQAVCFFNFMNIVPQTNQTFISNVIQLCKK
ncbi:hypothetical protein AW736_02650 [Termitidicoccus mucosus]|uniref:Uncharacterized protein n=1 Tax=Termitidicoccus mucosus TaxID=1184151 RepID=A0A178IQN3_9BACT|nr:hypothetical protein AW736_02650 [Opitutaceae bacterium TSB47]